MQPSPLPPDGWRRLAGPSSTAFVFDAASPAGRAAATRFFGRLAGPPPRRRTRGRARAGMASLCGEGFVRGLETAGLRAWERV